MPPGAGEEGGEGQGGLGPAQSSRTPPAKQLMTTPRVLVMLKKVWPWTWSSGGHQIPDKADGGHGVQAAPVISNTCTAKRTGREGGHPGQRRVGGKKGDAGQPHPGPAPCPPQQGENTTMAGMSISPCTVSAWPISRRPPHPWMIW